MSDWWAHTVGWGTIAALACGLVLIAVEFAAPYAFLSDYPEDIRKRAPKPTKAQERVGVVGGAVFFLSLLAGIGLVVWSWGAAHPGAGYLELALMACVVMVLFATVDVAIVDWLVICTWRPRRLVFPGTEDCQGWRDYGFHLKEQLRPRAVVALAVLSAGIGAVAWLLT